jgi:transposase
VLSLDLYRPERETMISFDASAIPPIPKETIRAAHAIFGRSNFYILVGDHLEGILKDLEWQHFLGGEPPSKLDDMILPLITFFQFVEGLTDTQAIDAVHTRADWKFALHLSLMPARLREHALCRFRQGIFHNPVNQREFQRLIDRLLVFTPSLNNNFQMLKSLETVAIVCSLNRLHQAQQAMNQALEVLAVRYPQWLRKIALPHWYGRYNPTIPRLDVAILFGEQRFLMEEIASDINHLLQKVYQSGSPEMNQFYEFRVLEQVWTQQFELLNQPVRDRPETLLSNDCEVCFHNEAGRRRQT